MHFFSFSPNPHLHRDLPDLVRRMPLVAFLLAGKWCREKGRVSPFAQCVRNFLELNCPFLKVPVLTLGSQYPWIASLVVRSKWRVNTPGSSSFSCSDQYSDSGRRDVTWSLLLPSLWSPVFYPSPLQPIWTPWWFLLVLGSPAAANGPSRGCSSASSSLPVKPFGFSTHICCTDHFLIWRQIISHCAAAMDEQKLFSPFLFLLFSVYCWPVNCFNLKGDLMR